MVIARSENLHLVGSPSRSSVIQFESVASRNILVSQSNHVFEGFLTTLLETRPLFVQPDQIQMTYRRSTQPLEGHAHQQIGMVD